MRVSGGRPAVSAGAGVLRLLRPLEWIKNVFVVAPLVFTGLFVDADAVARSAFAFVAFCIASSAAYVVNDLHDVESDRLHPVKSRLRPLASGAVTRRMALALLVALYAALAAAATVMPQVLAVVGTYVALNLAYTFALKHRPVLDLFTIALGFVLRVHAGATALSVPVSAWMFVTTLCVALYLAALKRRQELARSGAAGRPVLARYSVALVDRYAEMSGTGALVFYSMFVLSERPELVITVPLVLFGLFRYWYVVDDPERGESPAEALLADPQLLATVALWTLLCVWSLWPA